MLGWVGEKVKQITILNAVGRWGLTKKEEDKYNPVHIVIVSVFKIIKLHVT